MQVDFDYNGLGPGISKGLCDLRPDRQAQIEYWQYSSSPSNLTSNGVVVVLPGAFSTLRHFAPIAAFVQRLGFSALLLNHRGVGASMATSTEKLTTKSMALDAAALVGKLFSDSESFHLVGSSMGGMVAQHLAAILLESNRLISLFLAVSTSQFSDAHFLIGALPGFLFLPIAATALNLSPAQLVDKCLCPEYRDSTVRVVNNGVESTSSVGNIWLKRFEENFDDWFTFRDSSLSGQQMAASGSHHCSDEILKLISDSDVRVSVWIAEKDTSISPNQQHILAQKLNAHKIVNTNSGHTIDSPQELQRFEEALGQHLLESLKGTE